MMIPLYIPTNNGFNHGFQVVRFLDLVHPSHQPLDNLSTGQCVSGMLFGWASERFRKNQKNAFSMPLLPTAPALASRNIGTPSSSKAHPKCRLKTSDPSNIIYIYIYLPGEWKTKGTQKKQKHVNIKGGTNSGEEVSYLPCR